jgi:hypothetical protein
LNIVVWYDITVPERNNLLRQRLSKSPRPSSSLVSDGWLHRQLAEVEVVTIGLPEQQRGAEPEPRRLQVELQQVVLHHVPADHHRRPRRLAAVHNAEAQRPALGGHHRVRPEHHPRRGFVPKNQLDGGHGRAHARAPHLAPVIAQLERRQGRRPRDHGRLGRERVGDGLVNGGLQHGVGRHRAELGPAHALPVDGQQRGVQRHGAAVHLDARDADEVLVRLVVPGGHACRAHRVDEERSVAERRVGQHHPGLERVGRVAKDDDARRGRGRQAERELPGEAERGGELRGQREAGAAERRHPRGARRQALRQERGPAGEEERRRRGERARGRAERGGQRQHVGDDVAAGADLRDRVLGEPPAGVVEAGRARGAGAAGGAGRRPREAAEAGPARHAAVCGGRVPGLAVHPERGSRQVQHGLHRHQWRALPEPRHVLLRGAVLAHRQQHGARFAFASGAGAGAGRAADRQQAEEEDSSRERVACHAVTVSVWDAIAMWTRISGTQYSAVGNAAGRAAEMDPVGSRISGTHTRINLLSEAGSRRRLGRDGWRGASAWRKRILYG